MRDQAISRRRAPRRRTVRSASPTAVRRRRRPVSFRWILRTIPVLLYLAVLILAGWLLYYSLASPYFFVNRVVVSGSSLLKEDEARAAAGALGRNALLLRTGAVEKTILGIPVVKQVQAGLTLSGRLDIGVVERTPLVQWQGREGAFLVDREGVVFSSEAPTAPVTVVMDLDGPPIEVGSRVDPDVLEDVQTLEGAYFRRTGLKPPWFDYSRGSGLAVPTDKGTRVVFGDAEDLDTKLSTLVAIRDLLDASRGRAEIVDLRFKGRPVFVLPPTPVEPVRARPEAPGSLR